MSSELLSHRLVEFRELHSMTQAELARELGVTPRYLGYLETGQKDIDPNSSLYKLFTAMESGVVEVAHRAVHGVNGSTVTREEAGVYRVAPKGSGISTHEVLSQIRADLHVIETGATSEKRRAYHFLHEVHLPLLARLLKLT
jgi:transcriptional regulator with XRE-family HTH domain